MITLDELETKFELPSHISKWNEKYKIQIPNTVEEFRNNLRKYYVCVKDKLMVNNLHKKMEIDINELNSIKDLYSLTYRKNIIPMITPLVERGYTIGDFTIYDSFGDLLNNNIQPKWYYIDDYSMSFFYKSTLGKYNGYRD